MAGASGFVGTNLRMALARDFRWHALTRSSTRHGKEGGDNTEWRHCDLYSPPKVVEALEGARIAVYLVHSMLPTMRLVQGSFRDLDLLLADNFARGAEEAGVEHIVYLGGLIPEDSSGELSEHLASRLEVERVLRSRSVPVTTLRAGLIFGPGGSSIRIPINLVRRLPLMILPRWTRSTTHSIDIADVVRAFRIVLSDESFRGGTYDLGGHKPVSYKQLMRDTARVLGHGVRMIDFPGNLFWLSRHWVAWISGVSTDLVNPMQESLRHSLRARPNRLLDALGREGMVGFEESMRHSVDAEGHPLPNPRAGSIRRDQEKIREARRVQSVQRMPLPADWDAARVADEYGAWLTRCSFALLKVERDAEGVIRFFWRWPRLTMLELSPTPYSRTGSRRRAFYISGGLLSRKVDPPGRFEFRIFPEARCVVAAIHGFCPALPWFTYQWSQALVHVIVMRLFARHLGRVAQPAEANRG